MQAVILAAGKGLRMHPLTLNIPKPLLEIAGSSLLEHNLAQLKGIVDEVILIVGYKKEMIIEKLGTDYQGIKLSYVPQEEQLGTGHALLQAEKKIKGKFLMLNGDDLYSGQDIKNLTKYDNCILLQKKKDPKGFGVVIVKDGLVIDIIEKPKEPVSNLVNTGVYCFSLEVFPILKNLKKSARGEYEVTDAVKELAKLGKMHYQEVQCFWIPIGYPHQLKEAEEFLLKQKL